MLAANIEHVLASGEALSETTVTVVTAAIDGLVDLDPDTLGDVELAEGWWNCIVSRRGWQRQRRG
jgi:hypothetical protein